MNPYEKKRRWKIFLLVFAIVIGTASVFYTDFFVKKMEREEKAQFLLWVKSMERSSEIFNDSPDAIVLNSVTENNTTPIILTDTQGKEIKAFLRLDSTKTNYPDAPANLTYDPAYFQRELRIMRKQHAPLKMTYFGDKMLVFYKDSSILTQLRYFPYIQLSVIALFLITAYVAFSSARKAEQDQVWVGLAKETAHQLGTPISSLMAWIELIKSRFDAEHDPLVAEMENDLKRLEVITDRFSKIGSKPVLEDHVVYVVISDFIDYFKLRTSDKVQFKITGDDQVRALLNVPLFDWVTENLLKNAANAIANEGIITVNIIEHLAKEEVYIDVTDTGKGIPRSKFDAVFQPGYTTRKRGWGLGLSLTKRIIQNYHSGQIFVKDSELGKGTTFRIILKSSLTYEPTITQRVPAMG
ncbi:MAG: HAMP domain-containing histidine kinase [Pedobacter sp.]|nr:MAG: HAMP domain-containing histidine kinase [Pedobacter sp.]